MPVVVRTEDEGVRDGKIDIIVRDAMVFMKATNAKKLNSMSCRVHSEMCQWKSLQ